MTFDDALAALLDSDDWDAGFLRPTPEAIARAAELVPPTLDVRLSCLGVGDLRVHVQTEAYKRLTLVVPEDPEEPARIYWRRRNNDRSGMEDATLERWVRRLSDET